MFFREGSLECVTNEKEGCADRSPRDLGLYGKMAEWSKACDSSASLPVYAGYLMTKVAWVRIPLLSYLFMTVEAALLMT